jgi:biopolymer transport protein ExbD
MKVKRQRRITNDQPQLEMTPMIDVVFQLLIFFIVTIKQEDIYSMLSASAPAADPRVTEKDPQPNVLNIEINRTGFILRGNPVSKALLEKQLANIAGYDKTVSVVLRCTGDSPHKYLVQTLDICHKLQLTNLAIFSMSK